MTHRRTPLYDQHLKAGAKLVPFGGWDMPVSYEGVIAEHHTVRKGCGIFDVSHMGELFVRGEKAQAFLQQMTINDLQKLTPGTGQYSALLNPQGGMIDDLIVYCLSSDEYLICVNAANTDKDYHWLLEHAQKANVQVVNESSDWAQIAVQGPTSPSVLQALVAENLSTLPYMGIGEFTVAGEKILIARTGYTGEVGYELYLPNHAAAAVWEALLKSPLGVKPIGLGARDTLRLEACYLLYGNDMNDSVSPLEAGIGWATKIDKGSFIGREALQKQKAAGVPRKMVAFTFEEAGVPRHDMDVYCGEKLIGKVTSGSFLPTLNQTGGMALIDASSVGVGSEIHIDVRGKRKLAKVRQRPLYSARVK